MSEILKNYINGGKITITMLDGHIYEVKGCGIMEHHFNNSKDAKEPLTYEYCIMDSN